jgi:hypothetical protein
MVTHDNEYRPDFIRCVIPGFAGSSDLVRFRRSRAMAAISAMPAIR